MHLRSQMLLGASFLRSTDDDMGSDTAGTLEAQATSVASISAGRKEQEVKAIALRADNNPLIAQWLEATADAAETMGMSPVHLMLAFEDVYKPSAMKQWPVPGTSEKEGHENPDAYLRPSRRKGGGPGTATSYWSSEFAEGLRTIRNWRAEIEAIKEQKLGDMIEATKVERIESRINKAKGKVKLAIKLFHQIQAAKEYPAITFSFIYDRVPATDDDGREIKDANGKTKTVQQLAMREKPIRIRDAEDTDTFYHMSVIEFNTLDFAAATANGGTVKALLDTKRSGGGGDDETGDGIVVTSTAELESHVTAIINFLEIKGNWLQMVAKLEDKSANTDHELASLATLKMHLDGLLGKHEKRLRDIQAKQEQAA